MAIVSVALLGTKLFAYYLTHSVTILTDALESIVNVVAGFFGLYSLYLSSKPADADHPYGHGKIEFVSAAVEGTMIAVAAILIFIEAVQALISASPIHQLDIGIVLISATAIVNFIVGSISVKAGRKNHSLALQASGKHLLSDTYTTIGILIGLVLIYLTGVAWLDSVIAIVFSFAILFTAFRIIRGSLAGIMDERDKVLLNQVIEALEKNRSKNWIDIHNLRIIQYGSVFHVDCHLTVPWYFNVHEAHSEIEKLRNVVANDFGRSVEFFVHSDGCLPVACPICIKDDCPVRYHNFQRRIRWTVINTEQNEKHQFDTE